MRGFTQMERFVTTSQTLQSNKGSLNRRNKEGTSEEFSHVMDQAQRDKEELVDGVAVLSLIGQSIPLAQPILFDEGIEPMVPMMDTLEAVGFAESVPPFVEQLPIELQSFDLGNVEPIRPGLTQGAFPIPKQVFDSMNQEVPQVEFEGVMEMKEQFFVQQVSQEQPQLQTLPILKEGLMPFKGSLDVEALSFDQAKEVLEFSYGIVKKEESQDLPMEDGLIFSEVTTLQVDSKDLEEVIVVKVADPYTKVDENAVKQLSHHIMQGVKDGKEELHIQLNPEHLGKITIKISMLDAGVKVLLSCDKQSTLDMLADKSVGLGQIVEENLRAPVVVEIQKDDFWNQQKDATDQQQRNRQDTREESTNNEDSDEFMQQLRLGLLTEMSAL